MSDRERYKSYLLQLLSDRGNSAAGAACGNASGAADFGGETLRESFRRTLESLAANAHLQYGSHTVEGLAELVARRWLTASIERGSLLTRKVSSVWSATCGAVVRHSTTRRSQHTGGSFGRGWRNAIRTGS